MDVRKMLNNIPYGVYDGLSVLSAIITIVTAIISLFRAVVEVKVYGDAVHISFNKVLLYLLILVALISVIMFIKIRKYATILRQQRKCLAYNYYSTAHDLRNSYFEILKSHKDCQNNRMINVNKEIEILTKETMNYVESVLNSLCDILENLTDREIHGCVKLIENMNGSSRKINLQKATVKTFCRSKNTQPERKMLDETKDKSIKIIDNTDFYDILDENNQATGSYFYQSDLVSYEKHLEASGKMYKNSTNNWKSFYRSTIVAPIRNANRRLFFNKLSDGYDVVGFLCVDSKNTDAFRDNEYDRENYSYIVKSYAAEIYIVLNMYGYYLTKLKREMKNE